jgi:hypothetical protein
MAVYRIHSGGVWSRKDSNHYDTYIRHARADIEFFRRINKHLAYQYDKLIKHEIYLRQRRILHLFCCKVKKHMIDALPVAYGIYRYIKYNINKQTLP